MIGKPWPGDATHEIGELFRVLSSQQVVIEVVDIYLGFGSVGNWVRFGKLGKGKRNIEHVFFLYRTDKQVGPALREEAQTYLDLLRAGGVEVAEDVRWLGATRL
jgi:hypothetical protein